MKFPTFHFITTDESQYILPVTDYLMEKYSSQKINICYLGYTNPQYKLSTKSRFVELKNGESRNINQWFSDLYHYFDSIDDEYVVFTVDDNPLRNPLNFDDFEYAMEYLNNHKEIGILYTFATDNGCILYNDDKYSICADHSNNGHKTTSQMNIWKRTTLLKVLSSNYNNICDFEQQGWRFLDDDDQIVLYNMKNGQDLFPACIQSLCSENRNKNFIWALPIRKEDLEYCIDKGFIDKKQINYNGTHTHVFPYDYFNGYFTFSKMRQYAREQNWDENCLGNYGGYNISLFEKQFPHYTT
jgi:hypothetical protein